MSPILAHTEDITTMLLSIPLTILVPLLALLFILLRRASQYLPDKRINGTPRAPFIPDWIPFIGNALMLARGDAMWAGLVQKYGPAFRVRAMGDVRTFVCSTEVRRNSYFTLS
jgi:cholesterol 7alpha-monooxygenase